MSCFKRKASAPIKRMINSIAWCRLSFYIIEIQDKNMKNYPKSKTLRELEKLTLIGWHIVIKPSELCSGRKSISEKMSVD